MAVMVVVVVVVVTVVFVRWSLLPLVALCWANATAAAATPPPSPFILPGLLPSAPSVPRSRLLLVLPPLVCLVSV